MRKYLTNQTEDQKKFLIFLSVLVLFSIGTAVALNNIPFIRLKSDIYLRWYATTKLFADGRNLYDVQNSIEVDNIVYGEDSGLASGFYYPAHLVLLTGPLAKLTYPQAHLVWTIAIQLFYIIALSILVIHLNWPRSVNQKTIFIALIFFSIPNFQHTIWGQFNTIGILSLSLTIVLFRKSRYGLAGIVAAVGLTLKPQALALTLLWLMLWALFKRASWRFLAAFALTGAVMWLLAELAQPGWVFAFLASLDHYLPAKSVVDYVWNPHQITAVILVGGTLLLFFKNRNADQFSAAFAGCLALSTAVWALIIPIVGMFHILVIPIGVILIMSIYQKFYPVWYRRNLVVLAAIYLLGWLAFLVGLSGIVPYGWHIIWSEFVYKALLPLAVGLMALPLCLKEPNAQPI